jgi:hypothetical protein
MAKTNSHIPTVLKDFEQRHGRKPETLDEYRWVAAVAKEISAIEVARRLAAEDPPDVDYSNLCPLGTGGVYFSSADEIFASEDIEWNEA